MLKMCDSCSLSLIVCARTTSATSAISFKMGILAFCFLICGCGYVEQHQKERNFKQLCGVYTIDTTRTDLHAYRDGLEKYQHLKLRLNDDATFLMNFAVPFIYDSAGTWSAGSNEPEQWNWMISARNGRMDIQFGLYFEAPDSVLYLNSVTPREGQRAVSKIFFLKKSPHE